jgi:regulator of protease activity HflC (stomatin/prohibitin superfamily)
MVYTVKRFGKHTKTLKLGLHLIIPIIDRVGYKLNIRKQIMDVPSQEVVTKNDTIVQVNGVVLCQII